MKTSFSSTEMYPPKLNAKSDLEEIICRDEGTKEALKGVGILLHDKCTLCSYPNHFKILHS